MAAIDSEILVRCQDDGISEDFSHTNKAGIRKAHGNVGIFLDQFRDWLQVFRELEGDDEGTSTKQCANRWSATLPQEVVSLGESRLARRPRWRKIRRLARSPFAIGVAVT